MADQQMAMAPVSALPESVDSAALLALSEEHHQRPARFVGVRELSGHLVKVYSLQAPGRDVTEQAVDVAARIAEGHLALGRTRGSLGLAVLITHAGGDGDYVLVHTWIEGLMSDLAVFAGPAGQPDQLRPGRTGLTPCVWEAAILAHERDAFARHLLDGGGALADRLTAWNADTLTGDIR
ncbi:hypothetical protein ACGFNV_15320 [Streptomyces sp. NPDC048751]|uniref:hypothetical protein n=1 Tax=Streptomyces sp. NPDC048751 TaxID=3365591 RepID=UPI0037222493